MTSSPEPLHSDTFSADAILSAFAHYHARHPAPKPLVLGAWADSPTTVSVLFRWENEVVTRGRRLAFMPRQFDSEDFIGMWLSQEISEPIGTARVVKAADGTVWTGQIEDRPPRVPEGILRMPPAG